MGLALDNPKEKAAVEKATLSLFKVRMESYDTLG